MNIIDLPIEKISQGIKTKEFSAEEVCKTFLDHCQKENPKTNALVRINDKSIERARSIDRGDGENGNLLGVPVIVKDNFCVKGLETTACSKILRNFVSPYTAFCIQRLEQQGAVIIAQSNMDEFAMGSSNENSAYGLCKNPVDHTRVPGGSSGGSAAAVAQKMAPLSIGSDTGGSIRQPASFCGVTGIKPTYGAISRFGMIAFASSLDQAGTIGRTVKDAAIGLEAMIAKDPQDATNVSFSFDSPNYNSNKKFRVGIIKEYLNSGLQKETSEQINQLIEKIKSKGWEIVEVDIPHTEYAIPVYYLVAASEASSNLSRYDGVRYGVRDIQRENGENVNELGEFYKLTRTRGFGEEVKRRILLGTFSLSAGYYDQYYIKACQVRRLIAQDFKKAFEKCDHIIGPVTTHTAFKINEKWKDPIEMYKNDILTVPSSLAGLPCMSLPLGKDESDLPIGLQIISPAFQDSKMIEFASKLEMILEGQ